MTVLAIGISRRHCCCRVVCYCSAVVVVIIIVVVVAVVVLQYCRRLRLRRTYGLAMPISVLYGSSSVIYAAVGIDRINLVRYIR